MRKFVLLSIIFVSCLASVRADILAQWTFESTFASITGSGTTLGPLSPETGSGSATGVHASSASTWSSPAGNGSAHSFSVNTWGLGDYFQFQTGSLGFQNISVSFDATSSSTGPIGFRLDYSTDGSSFTTFSGYTVRTNGLAANNAGTGVATSGSWSSSTAQTGYSYLFDLSSATSLNNQSAVYFRLIENSSVNAVGNSVPATGTDRADNFTVTATLIPEPSSMVLTVLGGFALFSRSLFKRRQ